MTADQLRNAAQGARISIDYVRIFPDEAAAMADLIDTCAHVVSWCRHNDDGAPRNLIMQMGDALAALYANQ